MNANSYYEIGASHKFCQDYALTGQREKMTYAIVSDGCSSSVNSDVGARLLAHIAKGVLAYMYETGMIGEPNFTGLFKELVLKKCIEVKQTLGLAIEAFDATLLVSVVLENKIISLCWGDGYITYVTNTGAIIVYEAIFSSGAPYYLSYEMCQKKKDAYIASFGNGLIYHTQYILNPEVVDPNGDNFASIKNVKPLDFSYTMHKEGAADLMKYVVLSSDGIGTYQDNPRFDTADGIKRSYHAIDMISDIVAYKSIAGDFVHRRMICIKDLLEKNKIIHQDDIACATIAITKDTQDV